MQSSANSVVAPLWAALFDLDGVVVDTEGQYTKFWQQVGRRDFPADADFAGSIKGRTLTDILSSYYPGDPDRQAVIKGELEDFERHMDFPYVPGVADVLSALEIAGVPTAVVTSSNREKMACLYARRPEIKSRFTAIYTAEDAGRSKPAPDCYLNAARRLGAEASHCIVFEDSLSGVKAGHASGACVVGLTTTNLAEALAPWCDLVVNDFTGITLADLERLREKHVARLAAQA